MPPNLLFTITGIKLLGYFVQMKSKWQRKTVVILPLWLGRIGDYLNQTSYMQTATWYFGSAWPAAAALLKMQVKENSVE